MEENRVLVTGGKGFVGSHTVEALTNRRYVVRSYDILDGYDILNFQQLEAVVEEFKPTWIIHLAGQVCLMPSISNPQNDAALNIIGTLNILEVARKHNCGTTFSSSGAIYGNNYQYPEPISPYGVSKLGAETYCRLYHTLHRLHTVVFRFSSVYGFGRAPTSINLIIAKALRSETIQITGDGSQTRDFTYVTDIAEALVMSAEKKFPSGVYDTGTGVATSINELVHLLEQLLNKQISTQYIPANNADPRRNELNVSKAASYGFKAKVSLKEGLEKLIRKLNDAQTLSH